MLLGCRKAYKIYMNIYSYEICLKQACKSQKGENTKMTQNPKAQRKEATLRQEHKSDADIIYDTAKEPCYRNHN
jgi:hypothetical protein